MKPFALEKWFGKYEFTVGTDIASSCIKPFDLAEFLTLTGESLPTEFSLGYRDSKGTESLRKAVTTMYPGATVDNVLITIGASEANYLALKTLAPLVKQVVVQFPAYQQLYEVVAAAGTPVQRWQMNIEAAYEPNAGELQCILEHGGAVLVTNPHNPTGALLDEAALSEVHDLVAERKGWLYSDEVYGGLNLAGQPEPKTAWRNNGRTICIGSMSKSFGLAGSRIGWLVGPEELVEKCWSLRDYTSICPPALSEWLAETALRHIDKVKARNRFITDENLRVLRNKALELGPSFSLVEPRAGVLAFPRINAPLSTWELCTALAEEDDVLLVPGEVFEKPGYVRLGLGGDVHALERGLTALARRIQ